MKKRFAKLMGLLAAVLVCLGAAGIVQAATVSGKLNETYVVLAVGNKLQLKVTGNEAPLRWTTSNYKRATVSESGLVKGVSRGKVNIRARYKKGNLACTVLVRPKAKVNAAKNGAGSWKTDHGETYYIFSGGSMLTGCCAIKGVYYVFDENGRLQRPKKNSLVTVGKKTYIVSPKGRAQFGWQIVGKNLYYCNKWGQVVKNRSVEKIHMGPKGAARACQETTWQKAVTEVVNSITNEDMTKSEKLRACWDYLVSKENFTYYLRDIVEGSKDWQKITAFLMLTTHKGDCYNFAGAFAAMANCIGYESYMIYGRVSGSRDHAADGLTRHAWVRIDGKYYDPEGQFAGWYRGCYGSSSYDIRHQILDTYLYRS